MAIVGLRSFSCMTLRIGFDPTQCACAHDMSNRLIGRIPKYDHISSYLRDILRWLPARQRIDYRVAALVWRCLLGLAPAYLVELCGPTQSARSSRSLRSAEQGLLRVAYHLHAPPPRRTVPLL